jgi:hypothetical protein
MNKVVLINQSSGYLMIDIANEFARSQLYDEVTLIAGSVKPQGVLLDSKIRIRKIIEYKKGSTIQRMITWLVGTLQIIFIVKLFHRNSELFIVSNPPTNAFLPVFCKNRYSALIYDVYPDGLIAGGFVKRNSIIVKLWSKANKYFYHRAKSVFTITHGMAKVISQYVDLNRINVVPLWPSSGITNRIERCNNKFIMNNNLQDKFIVMYSGNIGFGHSVDLLVEIADKLKNEKDLVFVIIGEGWAKEKLLKIKKNRELSNIFFFPWQPIKLLNHSLSAAHIAYVSIEDSIAEICIPSKTYNLIKLNVPILSTSGKSSELYNLITKYNLGACYEKGEINKIIEFIRLMKSDSIFYNDIVTNIKKYSIEIENNAKQFIK